MKFINSVELEKSITYFSFSPSSEEESLSRSLINSLPGLRQMGHLLPIFMGTKNKK